MSVRPTDIARNKKRPASARPALPDPTTVHRMNVSFAEDARQQVQAHAEHEYHDVWEISCDLCWGDKPSDLRVR